VLLLLMWGQGAILSVCHLLFRGNSLTPILTSGHKEDAVTSPMGFNPLMTQQEQQFTCGQVTLTPLGVPAVLLAAARLCPLGVASVTAVTAGLPTI
jgi:hypothetical protein